MSTIEQHIDADGPFMQLVAVCEARGQSRLNTLVAPGDVFHVPINETWEAWINPHKVPGHVPPPEAPAARMGGEVPPFSAWINYNGWLWGLVDPFGGAMGAHPDPEGGNLEHFVRDCRAATVVAQSARGA